MKLDGMDNNDDIPLNPINLSEIIHINIGPLGRSVQKARVG
jgi:hypothetical protein